MRRSARLVSRRFWRVLGLALLSVLVEWFFETAIGLLPSLFALFLGTDGIGWVLSAAVAILTQLITMPVVAGITVLIYLDLRVRTEGLDLELDAIEAFPAASLMGLPPSEQDPAAVREPRGPDPRARLATTGRRSRSPTACWAGSRTRSPGPSGTWWAGAGARCVAWIIVGVALGGVRVPARAPRAGRPPERSRRQESPT